jgi:hypothetical protein
LSDPRKSWHAFSAIRIEKVTGPLPNRGPLSYPLGKDVAAPRSNSLVALAIEALETREVPAIFAQFSPANGGTLTVFGDDQDNVITIGRSAAGVITVNGGAIAINSGVKAGAPTVANTAVIQVFGQSGNDQIRIDETNGTMPAAQMFDGSGADILVAGSGADALHGQDGNDQLTGGAGNDFLLGQSGTDAAGERLEVNGLSGDDAIDATGLEPAEMRFLADGGVGNDVLLGRAGDDVLLRGAGADVVFAGGATTSRSAVPATTCFAARRATTFWTAGAAMTFSSATRATTPCSAARSCSTSNVSADRWGTAPRRSADQSEVVGMSASAGHESSPHTLNAWLLIAYIALLYFGLGAGLLESFLNYPMWWDMGARMSNEDFMLTRREHTWRVYPLLVVPLALRFPVTLALLWRRPRLFPQWALWVAVAGQLLGWASSGVIQIPIQVALTDCGFSDELFARLIVTDRWLRVLPFVCEAVAELWMLRRVVDELAVASVRKAE